MSRSQLAVMRALWIVGAVVLLIGIVTLIVDHSTVTETCTRELGLRVCEHETPSNRGLGIAGVGLVTLIGTAVAWSTLTPKGARRGRRQEIE